MKICPECKTQYTDDTLRFCLQDGSVLQPVSYSAPPTAEMHPRPTENVPTYAPGIDPRDSPRGTPDEGETPTVVGDGGRGGKGTGMIIAALVMGGLFLGIIAAIGLWLAFREPRTAANNSNGDQGRNIRTPGTPTATPTPKASPTLAANANENTSILEPPVAPTPPVDKQKFSSEVSRTVYDWAASAESGDLESQMQAYAATVDYYNKRGASREFVRADRARAYRMFDEMSIDLSNMNISVDDSGTTATAVFDKEWAFDGDRRSTGKVRQELRLRRVDGRWLIAGERDIKVYHTN